jgi:spectinomycin phosphotransferase
MVELYDLEWRLDEIAQYASRFSRRHSGDQDDQLAWDALQHELERPDSHCPP